MATKLEHTIFLWVEGMFPRRVTYFLFLKGLVSSPEQLLEGKTNDPSLKLNIIRFTSKGLEDVNKDDPRPAGVSTPALRIVDSTNGTTSWVYESTSILIYLDEIYSGYPSVRAPTELARAQEVDFLMKMADIQMDALYYVKNAAPVTGFWSGLPNQDRSLKIAVHAKAQMLKSLKRFQLWAEGPLKASGWLTPGTTGPGNVDICLAAMQRYLTLSYGLDMLGNEELTQLRNWYDKFRELGWWASLEEGPNVHPQALAYGKECLEI